MLFIKENTLITTATSQTRNFQTKFGRKQFKKNLTSSVLFQKSQKISLKINTPAKSDPLNKLRFRT